MSDTLAELNRRKMGLTVDREDPVKRTTGEESDEDTSTDTITESPFTQRAKQGKLPAKEVR